VRRLLIISAGLVTLTACGTSSLPAAPVPAVTRTVTRTVHVPGPVRTITKTITKQVTVPGPVQNVTQTTPCVETGGTVVPAAGAAVGGDNIQNCTIAIVQGDPASSGDDLVLTAPDGTRHSYLIS
jgi:multidrug efflux pump subunit AcrA (membrane-fusion protein)